VLAQCPALAHLDLSNDIRAAGAESLAGVLGQCAALAHRNLCGLGSAHRWLTSISATIRSAMPGQGVSQECWSSAQRCLTSISLAMAQSQWHRNCLGRKASSFVAWSSLWSSVVGTLPYLLVAICLADNWEFWELEFAAMRVPKFKKRINQSS
jgi:hypothetical protein